MSTQMSAEVLAVIATSRTKKLESWIKRTDKWFALCNALSTATTEEARAIALAKWEKGRPPSKMSKGHAYDYAEALRLALGLDVPRASTFEALKVTLTAAKSALK